MFTQDTALDPGWVVAEPNPGSSAALKKGLVLDASALNGGSDLWSLTNYNASLLLQPVSSNLDFTVTTKIDFQVTNSYMGAGLVLTTQTSGFSTSSAFHRFEYGDNPQPGLESFTNGNRDPNYVAFGGKLVWLKLQKSGSTYTYSYSTDGKTFAQISTVTDATPYTYIGLISVRQPYDGQTSVDARPVFKSFKIMSSKP
jgi:regulation of enolase protein 1 (concanavalin A-like superfamily)